MKKLLYFSPVPWASYKQRPHFFAEYFLRKGYEVLWVEPYPARLPKVRDIFRRTKLLNQGTPLFPERLALIRVITLPIEPLPFVNKLNFIFSRKLIAQLRTWLQPDVLLGIGKPSSIALSFLKQHRGFSFYDAMDDLPAFHSGISSWYLKKMEDNIARRVTKIFVSSTHLEQKFSWKKTSVIKIFNALDSNYLLTAKFFRGTPVTLGYVGTIADWFDWDLVIKIADQFSEWAIQLIGPVFTKVPKELPKNILLLGPIAHTELGKYLSNFTIGFIPFKLNRLTAGVDPIKYYEYKGMGLAVVSTNFGEMIYRSHEEGVFIIDYQNFVLMLHQALQYSRLSAPNSHFQCLHSWSQRLSIFDQLNF